MGVFARSQFFALAFKLIGSLTFASSDIEVKEDLDMLDECVAFPKNTEQSDEQFLFIDTTLRHTPKSKKWKVDLINDIEIWIINNPTLHLNQLVLP